MSIIPVKPALKMAAATSDKRLVRSKSGLKIVSLSTDVVSPLTLDEPQWSPDSECPQCKNCKAKFDFINRRHHCRRCGDCFCAGCCNNKMPLPRMCFVDPVRHCRSCLQLSSEEAEFFDKQLKLLMKGTNFNIKSSTLVPNVDDVYCCKISSDQRFLLMDGFDTMESIDPVDLMLIDSLTIISSNRDAQGNVSGGGIQVRYRDSCGEQQSVTLETADVMLQKVNTQWTNALHRAMKLILEKKNKK